MVATTVSYDGFRADMWSLGVCLYCLFHDTEIPFGGKDVQELIRNVTQREPPPCAHMPAKARDLMMRLLSKSPSARPTAAAVLQVRLKH